ncbi:CAP domain-containing protein [Herbidospora mongoliensis]|uniref:CAP domain-containing protein n=1 Tax=Herbidospora mongoliensis TaxID=688067 RepID=UPI00083004DA|nr:CAP domain-containing protein [Herbidospora mongoliensis]
MKTSLRALFCAGVLLVATLPATSSASASTSASASAAQAQAARCRIAASKPAVNQLGQLSAVGSRTGRCFGKTRVRVRIKQAVAGPDTTLKSGSKVVRTAKLRVRAACAPGVYYTQVTGRFGQVVNSRRVNITSCTPAPAPSPSPSPSPSATPSASPSATPTASPAPGGTTVGTTVENEVVRLTNAERAKGGCGPLTHDAKLRAAALGHSADMSAKNYFSHDSADGRKFSDRIRQAGFSFRAAGENIAKGYQTAAQVVQGWMDSPGHKANIMNCTYTHIGVGHVAAGGPYWTQDFAKP